MWLRWYLDENSRITLQERGYKNMEPGNRALASNCIVPSHFHTWCHRWAVLSWSCRRRDCLDGYTTAAYMGQMCGTVGHRERQSLHLEASPCGAKKNKINKAKRWLSFIQRNHHETAGVRLNTKNRKLKRWEAHHNNNQTILYPTRTLHPALCHCTAHSTPLRNTQPFMQTKGWQREDNTLRMRRRVV